MRLPFCGCGHPLWTEEGRRRGFCEYCRLHHCVHWPEFGHHPRGLPYFLPDGYENPDRKPDAGHVQGFNLMAGVIHRHTCPDLDDTAVPWHWAATVGTGEIVYAAAYFGYETCKRCHPLVEFESTLV